MATSRSKRLPFFLGFEGERWNEKLGVLLIPIPGKKDAIAVTRFNFNGTIGLTVVTSKQYNRCDNVFMAAAMARHAINQIMEGNDDEAAAMVGRPSSETGTRPAVPAVEAVHADGQAQHIREGERVWPVNIDHQQLDEGRHQAATSRVDADGGEDAGPSDDVRR